MRDHDQTSVRDLLRACDIGKEEGLRYVYAGNLPGHVGEWENTTCHQCDDLLIERRGFWVLQNRLRDSACPRCSTPLPGIWTRGLDRGQGEVPPETTRRGVPV